MASTETRQVVLDVAQELLQTRGYNAFSFRDLAERVQIKTASIHYHFPTKTDLCRALIARHRDEVSAELSRIDVEEKDPNRKLERYVSVFKGMLEAGNRMCLCGMLASDFATLDPSIVKELHEAFEQEEIWLMQVLSDGKTSGRMQLLGSPEIEARLLLSSLEGAMLVARTFEDLTRFDDSARMLLMRLRRRRPSRAVSGD